MSTVSYFGNQKQVNGVSVHASLFFVEHLNHPEQGYGDWAFTHLFEIKEYEESAKLLSSFEAYQSQYYTYLFERIALYQRGKKIQVLSEKEWMMNTDIEERGIFFMRQDYAKESWGNACMVFAWDKKDIFDQSLVHQCVSVEEAEACIQEQLNEKDTYSFVMARLLRASFWHTHM